MYTGSLRGETSRFLWYGCKVKVKEVGGTNNCLQKYINKSGRADIFGCCIGDNIVDALVLG